MLGTSVARSRLCVAADTECSISTPGPMPGPRSKVVHYVWSPLTATRVALACSFSVDRGGGAPARSVGVTESARLRSRCAGLGDRGGEAGIKLGAFPVSAARLTESGARAPLSALGTSRRLVEADRDRLARPIPPIAASTMFRGAASQPQRGCQLAWRVQLSITPATWRSHAARPTGPDTCNVLRMSAR